jgi:HlyD family secretion protein
MSKTKIYSIAGVAAVVLAAALISGLFVKSKVGSEADKPTYKVKRGDLTISYTESGTIKAKDQAIIRNEVEGSSSIVSVVPEGTRVKKGDLLVELNANTLSDQKIDQEIRVQNTEAAFISAKETLAVAENQAKSDIDLAKLTLEFAKQDLEKYIKGDYPYLLDEAEAKIKLAEEEYTRATQTLEDSNQLAKEKYISQMELQADAIAQKKCELDKSLAIKSRNLLEDYTKKRQIAQYESDVSQAEMAMERTERSAHASVIQAQADLKAKESEYNRQQDKLKKMNDQLGKTKIYAPTDGLVIYATSVKSNRWGNSQPLDVGSQVGEKEELIYLPAGDASKAEVAIHEAYLKKTEKGMPAIITVDAIPGKTYFGNITTIAPLPDGQRMWLNPDLKVYNAEISIDDNDPMLRTGMSCQAEIVIEQMKNVFYIPLQAVVRVGSEPTVYVEKGNGFEARKIQTGLDNNKMIHIISGLKEGEVVLLNPPLKSAAAENENLKLLERKIQNGNGVSAAKQVEQPKTTTQPPVATEANQPANTETPSAEDMKKKIENMSDEEKEKMRKQFENMTPEQKEQLRKQFGGGKPKEQ